MDWARDGRDWPNREASAFVPAGGIDWHVQRFGARGPRLLLLHGTGASTHSWAGLAPLLAADFRLDAVDLPGHGFTQHPPSKDMSLSGMARIIGGLVAALDAPPDVIIGHSAGAAVAVQMVLDGHANPDAILAINAAMMPFEGVAGQVFPPLARLLVLNPLVPRLFSMGASRSRVRSLLESTGSRLEPAEFERYHRLFNDAGHVGAALTMMARWDLAGLQRRWRELETPLHLIVGMRDDTIPPSDSAVIARGIVSASRHKLEGLGHLAHEEAPARVAELIRELVAHEIERRGAERVSD